MISRLMLSLKKASRDKRRGWTSRSLSGAHSRTGTQLEFTTPSDGPEEGFGTRSEGMMLSDFGRTQVEEKDEEEDV